MLVPLNSDKKDLSREEICSICYSNMSKSDGANIAKVFQSE